MINYAWQNVITGNIVLDFFLNISFMFMLIGFSVTIIFKSLYAFLGR